jgi:hypothetical protein
MQDRFRRKSKDDAKQISFLHYDNKYKTPVKLFGKTRKYKIYVKVRRPPPKIHLCGH